MRTSVVQSSFLSGVLDERASGRIETDAYQQGMLRGENIIPHHLGGVRRRGGCRFRYILPNQLARITSGITITAPQGGTTSNANDNNETTKLITTVNVGVLDPYIVVQYDLGSAKTIKFADVLGLASSGGSSVNFRIQYSLDNVTWVTMNQPFELVDATVRAYRCLGPVIGRYWRIVKTGGINMGAVKISLAEFILWQETAVLSKVKLLDFEVSTEDRYCVALTDHAATIFKDGVYARSVYMPYLSVDVKDVDVATDAETMVLVHEDYAPRFLIREGTNNFQSYVVNFEAIPTTDFGDASSPVAVSDIQDITFGTGWIQGDTFQVELNNARSGAIVFGGDVLADGQDATSANLQRAIQGLYTVKGFSGVLVTRTGPFTYRVEFADGSADNYQQMNIVPVVVTGSVAAYVTKAQNGTTREEPVWSSIRGWPRTDAFFEGRLYFGGSRSLLQSIFGSEVNNILNFEIREGLADEAIFTTISGQKLNAINGLFAGRSLQVFTSGGEYRYVKPPGTPIVPGDAPVNQTQYGSAKICPVTIDGATIFIHRTRKAVRDFRFDINQDAFDSLGVSALAPDLINGVTDLAAWNGSTTDEIGLVFVVNSDGTIAVFNSRKEAQVQAWTNWTTQGLFKSIGVVLEDIFVATQRTIADVDYLFFEQIDDSYYTDCSMKINQGLPIILAMGLSHLNGQLCRVKADGLILLDRTPAGGNITLERASTDIEVGLNFNPYVTPMPLNTYTPGRGPDFMSKRRVVKVRVKVRKTLGLLINNRVISDLRFDIDHFDSSAQPRSKLVSIEETTNWDETEEKLVTFSQKDPLPMEILAFQVILESNP